MKNKSGICILSSLWYREMKLMSKVWFRANLRAWFSSPVKRETQESGCLKDLTDHFCLAEVGTKSMHHSLYLVLRAARCILILHAHQHLANRALTTTNCHVIIGHFFSHKLSCHYCIFFPHKLSCHYLTLLSHKLLSHYDYSTLFSHKLSCCYFTLF